MSAMIVEVYNAFRKAGVPDDEAQAAAKALSESHRADLSALAMKADLSESKVEIIKGVIGIGFAQAAFVVTLLKWLH